MGLTGYKYSYQKSGLEPWAEIIQKQLDKGRDVQVYFNNTGVNASESARIMSEMLS